MHVVPNLAHCPLDLGQLRSITCFLHRHGHLAAVTVRCFADPNVPPSKSPAFIRTARSPFYARRVPNASLCLVLTRHKRVFQRRRPSRSRLNKCRAALSSHQPICGRHCRHSRCAASSGRSPCGNRSRRRSAVRNDSARDRRAPINGCAIPGIQVIFGFGAGIGTGVAP